MMNIYQVSYLISLYDGSMYYGVFDSMKQAIELIDELEPTGRERTTHESGYYIHEYPLNQRCGNPIAYDRKGRRMF